MGRARLVRISQVAAALALVTACTATSGTVRGIILDVEGSFAEVTGFTVLVEGDQLRFLPTEAGDYAFPLPHLREHLRTGEPVLVGWELNDGERLALSLDDG